MHDVIVIGGGLFGCIAAKHLTAKGAEVLLLDKGDFRAGSRPAACLMKPSWYGSMGRDKAEVALETLGNLYMVHDLVFKTQVKDVKVKWINPKHILGQQKSYYNAQTITRDGAGWAINNTLKCKHLVLAAGIWSHQLLVDNGLRGVEGLTALTGTAFTIEGTIEPRIKVWSPYKQLVKFNIEPGLVWAGDGTANKNYDETNIVKSQNRVSEFIEGCDGTKLLPITGHRPYIRGVKPCYLEEHAPGLWVITGGAKNGTIAAGWAAYELGKKIYG